MDRAGAGRTAMPLAAEHDGDCTTSGDDRERREKQIGGGADWRERAGIDQSDAKISCDEHVTPGRREKQ